MTATKCALKTAAFAAAAVMSWLGQGLAAVPPAQELYTVSASLKGVDGFWDYASFDPVRRLVYIARSTGVTAIDVDKGKYIEHLADAFRGHQVLALLNGSVLLVTNGGSNTISLLQAADGRLLKTLRVGEKPDAAIFDSYSGRAVVMNGQSGSVSIVNPKTQSLDGQIAVGGALEYAASNGAGLIFINVEDGNQLAVLDIGTRTIVKRVALPGCVGPGGLAYAPQSRVLISACGNRVALVIDTRTMQVTNTLRIGAGPDAVIYDPARQRALVPCGEGVMNVIDVADPARVRVVATIKTEAGARTGAVDPRTGIVYLPTAALIPVAQGHPKAAPGTFHVLVVTPATDRAVGHPL